MHLYFFEKPVRILFYQLKDLQVLIESGIWFLILLNWTSNFILGRFVKVSAALRSMLYDRNLRH